MLRRSWTTSNTGLYGLAWTPPNSTNIYYLRTSTNLTDWSEGIRLNNTYQILQPFDSSMRFYLVTTNQPSR